MSLGQPMQTQTTTAPLPWKVTYWDRERSRKGQHSVVSQSFSTREAADAFAQGRTLRGKPAQPVEVLP